VGGQLLANFPGYSEEKMHAAYEAAKNAAYKIIESKGATYYAIAVAASHIVNAILRDSKSVLPVSIPLHGQYGHHGVALSVPCIVGRNGVEHILETQLTAHEQKQLDASAEILKSFL
jgi:L-lactate dehydrogenase